MCGKISTRAGKRTFHLESCRRLIDHAVLEGLLVVAMRLLFLLCQMNTTAQIAVMVTVTNVADPVTRIPWTSSAPMASYQFRMCGVLPRQNVRTLTCDVTLAIATEAR